MSRVATRVHARGCIDLQRVAPTHSHRLHQSLLHAGLPGRTHHAALRQPASQGERVALFGDCALEHHTPLCIPAQVTARASTFDAALSKLIRALREHRIRGVSTNIPFLLNVLKHPAFTGGAVTT